MSKSLREFANRFSFFSRLPTGVPLHLALFPRLWLDVHAATHIDRKHIASLLCSSYTVDYVDAVLLDERSSLGVPAIHAFFKTFFPKLADDVLSQRTCVLIDNLVSSLTAMVEAVDVEASAHRLTGDLRALALVYSSSTKSKPPSSLLPALETLLSRTRTITVKEGRNSSSDVESPTKRRRLCADSCESADKELCAPINDRDMENNISEAEMDKADTVNDTMSSDSGDDKATATARYKSGNVQGETIASSGAVSPPRLVTTGNSCTNQLRCSLTNVSWLEMLEKTIVDLQTIVQVQSKNN